MPHMRGEVAPCQSRQRYDLRAKLAEAVSPQIMVELAGEPTRLRFTQVHLDDIRTVTGIKGRPDGGIFRQQVAEWIDNLDFIEVALVIGDANVGGIYGPFVSLGIGHLRDDGVASRKHHVSRGAEFAAEEWISSAAF